MKRIKIHHIFDFELVLSLKEEAEYSNNSIYEIYVRYENQVVASELAEVVFFFTVLQKFSQNPHNFKKGYADSFFSLKFKDNIPSLLFEGKESYLYIDTVNAASMHKIFTIALAKANLTYCFHHY